MFECQRVTLPNGLHVVLTPMANSSTITTWIMVWGGSRFEERRKAGISHVMEHMFFKGGLKYPTALELANLIASVGGKRNAMTGKEDVLYFVKHGSSRGNLGIDVLADMIINGSFPEEELTKEREVVLEEYEMNYDDPGSNLYQSFPKHLCYGNHPLGEPIIGTKETILSITRNDLFEYKNRSYNPNKMVVSVAGNINAGDFLKEIEDRFGLLAPGPALEWNLFNESQIPSEKVFILPLQKKEQAIIFLVTPSIGYLHSDYFLLDILTDMIGLGESSRLFQELREKNPLVYSISSIFETLRETGNVLSNWATSNKNIEKSLSMVLDVYQKIAERGVDEEELSRCKSMLIGAKEMNFESSSYISHEYGQDEFLFGKVIDFDEYKKIVNAVTTDEILRVARAYLRPERLKIAMTAQERFCDKDKLLKILEKAR